MNLLPLFLVGVLTLGFSCALFVLRERLSRRSLRPVRADQPRHHVNSAHFPVSRLPSLYR